MDNLSQLDRHCVLRLYNKTTPPGMSNIKEKEATLVDLLQDQMTSVLLYSFIFF